MRQVKIHKYSGILSAYGLVLADAVVEAQEAFLNYLNKGNNFIGNLNINLSCVLDNFSRLVERFEFMETECTSKLLNQGFDNKEISHERILHMRYDRTDCVMIISRPSVLNDGLNEFIGEFERRYNTEFGFSIPDRNIVVVSF